jgi:hypothetical protein
MSYSTIAIKAARLAIGQKVHPVKAWEVCAKAAYPGSETSQKKPCPKSAFLGLCEEGKVEGIPLGKYTRSKENKRYALRALEFLAQSKKRNVLSSELWTEVLKYEDDKSKRHNSQMEVVLTLWEAGLLKTPAEKH